MQDRIVKFFFSRRGLALSIFLSLLILLTFFVQMFAHAYRNGGWDYSSYLLSSKAFFNGMNPYNTGSSFPFIYPLFVCVLLFPLAWLPYWFANVVWFILNISALYFSTFILFRLYRDSFLHREIVALYVVPFVVLIDVIQNNLLNGQINFIVLLLCILFLKFHLESRKVLASIFLSTAVAIKLTPLILIVYLIARRELLLAGLTLIFSVFLVFGLPYAIRGGIIIDWYSEYIHSFVLHNIASHNVPLDGFAFSITSIINSLFPGSELTSLLIAGFISVAPIFWLQIISRKDAKNKQILFFALYMLAILLITPMSETHHLINLLPAVVLVTIAMLFHPGSNFQMGIFTLSIVSISLFTRKFHIAIAVIGILTLYGSVLWIFFNSNEKATAYNK